MHTRTSALGVAVISLALVASACGSTGSSSSPTTAAPAGTTTTAAAGTTTTAAGGPIASVAKNPTAAGKLPAAVVSKGTLTVALDATYAPDEFVDKDGKTVVGMDADLANAIGQELGLKVTLLNATFDTIITGITSGKYDMGASSFTDTKEREKTVDFVTYFSAGEGYYVPANSTTAFDGLDSLCGHKVAVEKGTTEETDATTQSKTCTTGGKPAVTVLSFDDQNAANLAVSSGRAELGFVDSQIASYIVAQSGGQFKTSGKAFATAPYGLAIAKNGIGDAVLEAVKDLIANGTYGKILAKWGVSDGGITTPVINGATS